MLAIKAFRMIHVDTPCVLKDHPAVIRSSRFSRFGKNKVSVTIYEPILIPPSIPMLVPWWSVDNNRLSSSCRGNHERATDMRENPVTDEELMCKCCLPGKIFPMEDL